MAQQQLDELARARAAEFDLLHRRCAAQLIAALAGSTGDRAGAEAAVQQAFARAWQHWERVRVLPDPQAWVRERALRLLPHAPPPAAPTPASARALGERRRRRSATAAALVALAAAAVAVLVLAVQPGRSPRPEVLLPQPRPPAEDPVRALLLDPADLPGGPWQAREVPAELVLPVRCAPGVRFAVSPPAQGDAGTAARTLTGPQGSAVGHAVLLFGSPERAQAAWERLAAALETCAPARSSTLQDRVYAEGEPGTGPFAAQRVGSVLTVVRAPGSGLPEQADAAALKALTHGP